LLQVVESVSMETDTLSDVISQLEANVSTAGAETEQLATQATESETQLRDLQRLVGVLEMAIRVTALQNLEEAQRLSQEILSEVQYTKVMCNFVTRFSHAKIFLRYTSNNERVGDGVPWE